MIKEIVEFARCQKLPLYSVSEYDLASNSFYSDNVVATNSCCDIYSISKNFTATAIGMLCDDGMLSVNNTVYDLFHEQYPDVCNDRWRDVTIGIVLSQTTGIGRGFLDLDCDDASKYPTDDYLRLVLDEPFAYKPGTVMQYSDSNFYLLSRIVYRVCGIYTQDLLRERLFNPLGFQGHAWACCPQGHALGGTGLFLRSLDIAKTGALYLREGEFGGKRILSEKWVREATSPHVHVNGSQYYGYSFWMRDGDIRYQGNGMFGQLMYILPAEGKVIAWTAFDPECKLSPIHTIIEKNSH